MTTARRIATLGGVGYLRPAPGSWGALAAIALAWLLHAIGGFWFVFAATFVMAVIGHRAIQACLPDMTSNDPSEIVVDELVGQWIALWPVSFGAMFAGVPLGALWPGLLTAFIAFRVFDIWKPGPVAYAERLSGARGVMADDIVAGWLAALVVAVIGAVAHLVLI
ncbi:MAG: phosphatidylglycerophosphatase A [Pseudomonadota bacterium]